MSRERKENSKVVNFAIFASPNALTKRKYNTWLKEMFTMHIIIKDEYSPNTLNRTYLNNFQDNRYFLKLS